MFEVIDKSIFENKGLITANDVYDLIMKNDINPELITVINRILSDPRPIVDVDNLFLQILLRLQTSNSKDYLILIGLCLKAGIDINMYVSAPNFGIVHILGYIYLLQLLDPEITTIIIIMLIYKGSNPSFPIYDNSGGKIKGGVENIGTERNVWHPSIGQWIKTNYPTSIINYISLPNEVLSVLGSKSSAEIALLLDEPALINLPLTNNDMKIAIRCFDTKILTSIPDMTSNLINAVIYYNSYAFNYLLEHDERTTYMLINEILIRMRQDRERGFRIGFTELETMLLISIKTGTILDSEQFAIINSFGPDIIKNINDVYQQPYWKKACSQQPNDNLKRLAKVLGVKDNICQRLSELVMADQEELKKAAFKRQQMRIAADVGYINEFIGGNVPIIQIRNISSLKHDLSEYNDLTIIYYRDTHDVVWGITYDLYDNILETRKNPYSLEPVPDTVIAKIELQKKLIKELDFDVNLTYSQAIAMLSTNDKIDDSLSIKMVEKLKNSARYIDFDYLTKNQIEAGLASVGVNANLRPLTNRHTLITMAYIVDELPIPTRNLLFNNIRYQSGWY